jgi:hypothetical protein
MVTDTAAGWRILTTENAEIAEGAKSRSGARTQSLQRFSLRSMN